MDRRINPIGLVRLFFGGDTKLWVALPKKIGLAPNEVIIEDRIEVMT